MEEEKVELCPTCGEAMIDGACENCAAEEEVAAEEEEAEATEGTEPSIE